VQDVAVNCIYASGCGVLGDLAAEYDTAVAAECYTNQKHSEKGIIETLFSKSAGHFVTGYKDDSNVQSFHDVKVVQMLFPLLLDSVSSEQISCIVDYLTNKDEYWTTQPVPSVSKAEAEYNPIFDTDLLWRGPSWGFTNWFIMESLQKHGQTAILNQMMDRWISAVQKGGVWEMWKKKVYLGQARYIMQSPQRADVPPPDQSDFCQTNKLVDWTFSTSFVRIRAATFHPIHQRQNAGAQMQNKRTTLTRRMCRPAQPNTSWSQLYHPPPRSFVKKLHSLSLYSSCISMRISSPAAFVLRYSSQTIETKRGPALFIIVR
jgi:hypothetical protein